MSDEERRHEELEALQAFYGDDVTVGNVSWKMKIASGIDLEIILSADYPSKEAPIPCIHAPSFVATASRRKLLEQELLQMYQDDTEVAIMWVEHLRATLGDADLSQLEEEEIAETIFEAIEDSKPVEAGARVFNPPSSKFGQHVRQFQESVIQDESNRRHIFRGHPYRPPKSGPAETLIAHVASVESMDHVNWVLAELLFNDKKVAKASHNMIAYRFWDARRQCWVSDNDDDGEKGSGAKLAALLEMADVTNVIVVVSRWFGGIHLGPSRFKYFASVARDALEEAGFLKDRK